jgi:peptidoglycan/xylan/chitin deacetylase (PgdA/CDA1 family)
MIPIKRWLLNLTLLPGVTAPFSLMMHGYGVIFMLHRFSAPELGVEGHDPDHIRRGLAYLRRRRYSFISLEEMFRKMAEGEPLGRVVAFTIDDGYKDHATVGAKIFAEYDCPVTTFLTTGFLDHGQWFWWDKIDYIFSHTRRQELAVATDKAELHYRWEDDAGRRQAQADFIEHCKAVPDEGFVDTIDHLAQQADVDIPERPGPRYSPMSWEEARACERLGMTFGPHTVTHPILSQVTSEQLVQEISESWKRLTTELQRPVPIFCYPFGRAQDAGLREFDTLRRLGLKGAVLGVPGYSATRIFRKSLQAPYCVRRFGYPDNMQDFIQIVAGIERFKQILRGETN